MEETIATLMLPVAPPTASLHIKGGKKSQLFPGTKGLK